MKVYEHRIDPDDPNLVEVRRKLRPRRPGIRGRYSDNWQLYMRLDSPKRAAEIMALLHPRDVEAQVRP